MTAGVAGVYGDGSYGAHWRESVMGPELMTSRSEAYGVPMPLSRITVAAMEDIGYTVDYAAADRFSPPPVVPPAATPSAVFTAGASAAQILSSKSVGAAAFSSPGRPAAIVSPQPPVAEINARAAVTANTPSGTVHSSLRRPGLVSPVVAHSSASVQAVFAAWYSVGITANSR